MLFSSCQNERVLGINAITPQEFLKKIEENP
jgi:hypothetical protein